MASYFHEIDPTQFKRYWLDVSYADHDPRQKMDIWLPDEGDGPFPLIVFVHGGGWVGGDKRENTMPGAFKVMSQGYALACIEYRIAPIALLQLQFGPIHSMMYVLQFASCEHMQKSSNSKPTKLPHGVIPQAATF